MYCINCCFFVLKKSMLLFLIDWSTIKYNYESILKNSLLYVEDLWHKYGSNSSVLKGINLDIKQGELVGLIGPSGCGKTTLLRLIAGFDKPCKGKIFKSGDVISHGEYLKPPEKRGIGMVFQNFALFPHLNLWQNTIFGIKKSSDKTRAFWLLDLLEISHLKKRYPHELSGGQKQRLALARALAPGPSMVLLDEPFSSLDAVVRLRLRNELKSVLESCNASGLIVTHDPNEAIAICDRVAVMNNGEIYQYSSPSEIYQKPSSPYVGNFVFQKNILPVNVIHDSIQTPIGRFTLESSIRLTQKYDVLLFDCECISVSNISQGSWLVKSREFFGDFYVFTLVKDNLIVRAKDDLHSTIQVGEMCQIRFKKSKRGLLYPGSVECKLT